jgi:hypothetical protein
MLFFPGTTTANEYVSSWLFKMLYKFSNCYSGELYNKNRIFSNSRTLWEKVVSI